MEFAKCVHYFHSLSNVCEELVKLVLEQKDDFFKTPISQVETKTISVQTDFPDMVDFRKNTEPEKNAKKKRPMLNTYKHLPIHVRLIGLTTLPIHTHI